MPHEHSRDFSGFKDFKHLLEKLVRRRHTLWVKLEMRDQSGIGATSIVRQHDCVPHRRVFQ
jgi:hypothetical protein